MSRDGDIVEVDDGFYFENDIVIEHDITIRSRTLFGAVITSSGNFQSAIFIVRAKCEISGFILKNAYNAVIQRDSPDVAWKAHDLAILNCGNAISVNDRLKNRGSAEIDRIIIDRCVSGVTTNEARSIDARRLFIARTEYALVGSNHDLFTADHIVFWNCLYPVKEDRFYLPKMEIIRIEIGPDQYAYRISDSPALLQGIDQRISGLFGPPREAGSYAADHARRMAVVFNILAESYLEIREWAKAKAYFGKADELSRRNDLPEIRWRIEWGLGQSAEGNGDVAVAIARYRNALDHIDRIGMGLPTSSLLAEYRGDKIDVYDTLLRLLVAQHRREPGRSFDKEAFRVAEQSKARSIVSSLPIIGADEGIVDPTAGKEERLLAFRLAQCQKDIQDPNLLPEQRIALIEKLKRIEADRNDYFLRTGQSAPDAEWRQFFNPIPLERIQRGILGESEALVEYVVGSSGSYAFLVTRDGLDIAVLPAEKELRSFVEAYLKYLVVKDSDEFHGWEGGHKLWRILLAPFQDRLEGKIRSLIIVPDGSLNYLPFEALVSDRQRERFVIEDFDIRYEGSASSLFRLRSRENRPEAPMDFIGVADTNRKSLFSLSSGDRWEFPALPNARREILSIAKWFPRERTTLLVNVPDLETAFKGARLRDYRIIHLAVHGWIDDQNWMRSSLLLGGDFVGNEDGFLQPSEIRLLRLNADLVVLAGCETALGRMERGEGIQGFSTSFLEAGARSLVISQWALDDKAALEFMRVFYKEFVQGENKAGALRAAKLSLLHSPRKHPVYWAPFILYGE